MRKGDFDNIVDDLSDDEGDEAAGAAARAEMELLEDRARDRAIITAVTEGHDAMRSRAKKGAFSFDKLVGDNALLADKRRRKQGEDGGAEGAPEEEEEFDEEELMQRGMQNRTDRERLSRARRGGNAGDSDYDSDSSAPSDGDEDMFELLGEYLLWNSFRCLRISRSVWHLFLTLQPSLSCHLPYHYADTSGMTEEEKVAEMERVQSLREKNRQDALMAKQRIQSYKVRQTFTALSLVMVVLSMTFPHFLHADGTRACSSREDQAPAAGAEPEPRPEQPGPVSHLLDELQQQPARPRQTGLDGRRAPHGPQPHAAAPGGRVLAPVDAATRRERLSAPAGRPFCLCLQ